MLSKTVLERGNLLADTVVALLLVERSLLELLAAVLSHLGLSDLADGVGADGLMSLGVHLLHVVSIDTGLDELGELALVLLGLLSELAHVVGNVATENVATEDLSIEGLLLGVPAGEALLAVGNVNTAINGTLEGTKDLGTSGGAAKTNIEEGLEGAGTLLHVELGGLNAEGVQGTASAEQTSAVSSGVVGETNLDTVSGELVGVSRGQDHVTLDLGIHELADDVGVREADDETVLGGVVLVLVLDDQALASIVVSLSLTATTVLNLETLEVGSVLDELNERLIKMHVNGWFKTGEEWYHYRES